MFKNLQETIKALNADAKNVANCEKAKNLRKKLLTIGLTMAIVGFLGVFACFVMFTLAGANSMGTEGFSTKILVPFLLFIPCGIIAAIGAKLASLGFKIVVAGYTTSLIDETVGNSCPKCGEAITPEMQFCSKCGTKVRKECSKCKHINNHKSEYCEKCGTKLD